MLEILVTANLRRERAVCRVTGRCCRPVPPRLRNLRSSSLVEGRPHVGGHPAARLQGDLEQDGKRHAVLAIGLEIPGVGQIRQIATRPNRRPPSPRVRASIRVIRSMNW